MLCRGGAKPQATWSKRTSSPVGTSTTDAHNGGGGDNDSENDDFMAPPSFRDSFGAAIQDVIDNALQNVSGEDNVLCILLISSVGYRSVDKRNFSLAI